MNEVKFSESESKIIAHFIASSDKSASDWSKDEFTSIKKTIKDHYIKEQNYTCCFCKQRIVVSHNRAWDAEHILSRFLHPAFMFEPKNLCITCIDCNIEKSSKPVLARSITGVRYPVSSSTYIIVHPHFDQYEDHLEVIVAGQLYRWKTPKGRKTINTYGLDRFLKVAERPQESDSSQEIKKLMQSALSSTSDYADRETELLETLLLKYSDKIGAETSIEVIKKIRR
jgi:hypothetical protein